MSPILILLLITVASGVPINMVQKAADNDFEKLDNYLPKVGDFPKFHYSTFGGNTGSDELTNVIEFKSKENAKSLGSVMDFVKDETTTEQETTTVPYEATTELEITTKTLVQLDPVFLENVDDNTNRTIRQDGDDDNDVEVDKDKSNDKEKESQESDEEEEDQNMITGLLSAFLSGLSRPDGSVDVEAITGLLGSLSTQNPDGSYDFNGLTELLMSFFGGGGEEGGGSDFGAFLGGLLGAFIKGVAQPPGAKGSGIFVGNLLTGILPALSGPAPTEEGQTEKPQPPLDSGGFLGGLLSSIAGSSGSFSAGSSGGNNNANGGGGGSKFSLFKAIFSMITSVFSSSSAAH
nr:PREDICTED: putative lysozyme-like protein isoform X2 [Tribolium castaneum]|eukprot:XP_015835106.1 PREDICTED: putative lysozyme-like protein isoform X2 [Tribolium castaneum]